MTPKKVFMQTPDGSKIYYEKYGQGFPVFLLHGNLGNGRFFSRQIPVLAKYFQLFVIDCRGHGRSTNKAKQLSFQLLAEDLNEVMTNEKIKTADIVGFSDGANIAMVFAATFPSKVHRLVLNAGNSAFAGLRLLSRITGILLTLFFQMMAFFSTRMRSFSKTTKLWTMDTKLKDADLKKIATPTLIIVGAKDIIKSQHSQYLAHTIPDARLVVVENQGHQLARKAPQQFNQEVLHFLKLEDAS